MLIDQLSTKIQRKMHDLACLAAATKYKDNFFWHKFLCLYTVPFKKRKYLSSLLFRACKIMKMHGIAKIFAHVFHQHFLLPRDYTAFSKKSHDIPGETIFGMLCREKTKRANLF